MNISQIKKLPISTLLRIIEKAKRSIEKDEVWISLCQENDTTPDFIYYIPTLFGDLDVSAKTDHGVVILNYKLLCTKKFEEHYSYLIHEYSHWFQQCFGDGPTQGADDGEYLENPNEQEGFQYQVEYIANNESQEAAEDYVSDLLEHHEIEEKKKDKLETILLKNID